MKKFVWASIHKPSESQIVELKELGMEELEYLPEGIQRRINNTPSTAPEMRVLCDVLRDVIGILYGYDNRELHIIQMGGSPAFQMMFGSRITYNGINEQGTPWKMMFAHSERISEDIPQSDGSIKKVSTFRHSHFIAI